MNFTPIQMQETFITIKSYTIQDNSTVDNPIYKYSQQQQLYFDYSGVTTLTELIQKLQEYGNYQGFCRLCHFGGAKEIEFFDYTEKIIPLLQQNFVSIGMIRYTKQQASQLQGKVSDEEAVILDSVLSRKRVYIRNDQNEKHYSLTSIQEQLHYFEFAHLFTDKTQFSAALAASGVGRKQAIKMGAVFEEEQQQMVPIEVPIRHLANVQRYLAKLITEDELI